MENSQENTENVENMFEDIRNYAKNALKTVIKKENNINIIEKNIYNIDTNNLDNYKNNIYETIGNIIYGEELKIILSSIKNKEVSWNSNFYSEYLKYQEEQDDYIENPFEIVEGIFQCIRCNSNRVFSYSKQTRAGDEGTTVYAQCSVCKNKWIASN